MAGAEKPKQPDKPPEIQDQYEDLLNTVWDAERRQRMNDRIDAALRTEPIRKRRRKKQ